MKSVRLAAAGCSALAVVCAAPAAHAESHKTLDVTAGVRAASNPFLIGGSGTGSGAATIEATPSIEIDRDTSIFTLDGSARLAQYFQTYGSDFSARVDTAYDQHLSEATHVRLAGAFSTSEGGSRDLIRNAVGAANPAVLDPNADVSVAGARFRQYYYGADLGLFSNLSARDTVEVGGAFNLYDPKSTTALPYRLYSAHGGYSRALSETARLGARVNYSYIDYRHRVAGDGDTIAPTATLDLRASETWTINASAGAAFTSIKQAVGGRIHYTGFVGTLTLCNQAEIVRTCLTGSRAVEATALSGVSNVTSIGAQQDWRFSERDTLSLFGRYGENNQPASSATLFGVNRSRVVSASADYTRQLTERLFLVISPSYEKAWGLAVIRKANYGGAATLRYRFGG